ncbi:Alpha/Beta_hydrolase fold [Hexamita inflata]|uniref:Alpha/Beta hydrolase fold n=1 Tax=Hexamita inflata TaxID=28002 RepID=A0AA86NX10_9EUKA|nr:Alpha/Beta hydrolase fold [Hexamita inflata]
MKKIRDSILIAPQVAPYLPYQEEYKKIPKNIFEPVQQTNIQLTESQRQQIKYYAKLCQVLEFGDFTDGKQFVSNILASQDQKRKDRTQMILQRLAVLGIQSTNVKILSPDRQDNMPAFVSFEIQNQLITVIDQDFASNVVTNSPLVPVQTFYASQVYLTQANTILTTISPYLNNNTPVFTGKGHGASIAQVLVRMLQEKAAVGTVFGPAPVFDLMTANILSQNVLTVVMKNDPLPRLSKHALSVLDSRINCIKYKGEQINTEKLSQMISTGNDQFVGGYILLVTPNGVGYDLSCAEKHQIAEYFVDFVVDEQNVYWKMVEKI